MKYRLTDETIKVDEVILHRIECVEAFPNVKAGDKGGWIEKEDNLSQKGYAWVRDDAKVYGNAWVYGNAKISRNSDYIVFKNNFSSGRYFTWTRSNNMWTVGCFHGTGEKLIEKAKQDNEDKTRRYALYVKLVEDLQKVE